MFGIVWSLVEILSRAAGSRLLLDVSRSPPCEHAMWRDCATILRRGKPFVLAYLAVSPLTRLDPEINESQAPLARTVLTVKRSRGLLRCDLPFSPLPLMICRDFVSCERSWITLTFRPLCTHFVFGSAKSVVQRGAKHLGDYAPGAIDLSGIYFITLKNSFLCSRKYPSVDFLLQKSFCKQNKKYS